MLEKNQGAPVLICLPNAPRGVAPVLDLIARLLLGDDSRFDQQVCQLPQRPLVQASMVQQHQPPLNEIGQRVHPFISDREAGDGHRHVGPDNAGAIVAEGLQDLCAARAVQLPCRGDLRRTETQLRRQPLLVRVTILVAGRKASRAGNGRFSLLAVTERPNRPSSMPASPRPVTGKSSACRR